jgi:hypothetical protein
MAAETICVICAASPFKKPTSSSGAGTILPALFVFEESPQIDAADGGSGGIKTAAHLNLLAHLRDQLGGDMEDLGLTADEDGNLKLRMEVLAVGAMAVGAAATAFAFDEGAGQHFAEGAEAADEPAAGFEFRIAGHFLSATRSTTRCRPSPGARLRGAERPE